MEDICIDSSIEYGTKSLAFLNKHESMEFLVADTLVQISKCKEFYESVLESSFAPHKPLKISNAKGGGSINISATTLAEHDDATEVCSCKTSVKNNRKKL